MYTSMTRRVTLGLLICGFVALEPGLCQKAVAARNLDARAVLQASIADLQPTRQQRAAQAALTRAAPDRAVEYDPVTGVARKLLRHTGYLTEAAPATDAETLAVEYARQQRTLLRLTAQDLRHFEVTDRVFSRLTGATHIYLRQTSRGIPLYNGQLQVNINRDGRILSVHNAFHPDLAARTQGREAPALSPPQALRIAAESLGLDFVEVRVLTPPEGERRRSRLLAPALSRRDIDVELFWLTVSRNEVQLVWNFQVETPDGDHFYDFNVDAVSGKIWTRFDWTADGSYRVFAEPDESPIHGSQSRILVDGPEDLTASPNGWFPGGTMAGNNVHACPDRDGNNACDSDPQCSSTLCDFPLDLSQSPTAFMPAAVANLFYWNNRIHDVQYQYGFDEVAGNFQENNFGQGGVGSDAVNADAQDGSGNCNASFSTPTDGSNPRMQMLLCNRAAPARDGALDNGLIVHEYGHGISIRQVGGPSNSSCLNNFQQAGEGWSDYLALAYTQEPGDAGTDARGVASYFFALPAEGGTIRELPYSTDPAINNWTYESIAGASVPHGVGSRWAQVLWEMHWMLVEKHGLEMDLESFDPGDPDEAGNKRALFYINEGLKNTACSPSFLDGRDGIISAVTDNFEGEDLCDVWQIFADFGLGIDAVSGGSNSLSPTNGFQLPPPCPPNTPPTLMIMGPETDLLVPQGAPVTFMASAWDLEDGDLTDQITWTSDLDGALGASGAWTTTTLSLGTHTITAIVTDSEGASDGVAFLLYIVQPGAGGCAACLDANGVPTASYSNQDVDGDLTVEDGGATWTLGGNTWRRTTQTFDITPATVLEFEFLSTEEGEIHAIGFEENDSLNDAPRLFQIFGTQTWAQAIPHQETYTAADLGTYKRFRIEVGQFYTGTGMFLVLVNDQDAATVTGNNGHFRNVRVYEPPPLGTVQEVQDLYDEIETLSNLVTQEIGNADGGRTILIHARDFFFPLLANQLRSELQRLDFAAPTPFVDLFESEVTARIDQILVDSTDAELHHMIFEESELELLPDVFAEVGPVLAAQIVADSGNGGLLSGIFSKKWLWNWSVRIGGFFARGIGQLAVKLVEMLHDYAHSDDPATFPKATDLTETLNEAAAFATVITDGETSPTGGREVITFARDHIETAVVQRIESGLKAQGRGDALPFLDSGLNAYQQVADDLLLRTDEQLNQMVYDSDLPLLAEAILLSQTDLAAHINAHTEGAGNFTAQSGDVEKALWDLLLRLVSCIPEVGDLAEKLIGAVHDLKHSATLEPEPESTGVAILSDLSNQVELLLGNPERGRLLLTYVHDVLLPEVQSLMEAEITNQALPSELIPAVAIGIQRQQERIQTALDTQDDLTLNENAYDGRTDVLIWSSTFQETVVADADSSSLAFSPKTLWKWIVELVKCLSGSRRQGKLSRVVDTIHGLLH
jgi:hypothetical protein